MTRTTTTTMTTTMTMKTTPFETKNRINSNVTLPIWGGDLVFDISGEIDDANSLKSIMLFRRYH